MVECNPEKVEVVSSILTRSTKFEISVRPSLNQGEPQTFNLTVIVTIAGSNPAGRTILIIFMDIQMSNKTKIKNRIKKNLDKSLIEGDEIYEPENWLKDLASQIKKRLGMGRIFVDEYTPEASVDLRDLKDPGMPEDTTQYIQLKYIEEQNQLSIRVMNNVHMTTGHPVAVSMRFDVSGMNKDQIVQKIFKDIISQSSVRFGKV